jgi:DNA polymerase elongation subunit (family B)
LLYLDFEIKIEIILYLLVFNTKSTLKKGNKTYTMNNNMSGEIGTSMKIKVKKTICSKSFRLIDFRVYDDVLSSQKQSSDDETEKKPKEKPHMIIQMFGVNEKGETCSIYVNNYTPFFYVKVADNWTDYDARCLYRELVDKAEYHGKSILDVELVNHKKLYGFTAGKDYKFAKITFKNSAGMNKTKNLWYGEKNGIRVRVPFKFKGINLDLYESNIPPLLRYFHIHNISPSGWVQISTTKSKVPEIKTTTCDYEYICGIENLKPLSQKETRVPYKICSFDIEASSSHGDFPVPVKTYKRLASNMIDAFNKQPGLDESKTKSLVQLIIMAAFGYEKFDDIDLVYPKLVPKKEEVKKMIHVLLETSIKDAEKMNSDITSKLMTITSMFENMNNCNDITNDGNINNPEDDEDNDELEECVESRTFYKKSTKMPKITAKTTIIDVLLNEEYDRDQKLQFLDKVLTSIFPALEGDKVTFIGSTFMRYGEPEPYLNHCLVLGSCDSVENAVIDTAKTENELLIKWTELIQQENPDIIIGYNIFGFDYEFMFRRAQENHCERDFLMLSRNKGELSATENKQGDIAIENTKVQLASGEYDLRYFKTSGRLQIDMYTYFRRDFNLSSYKLDDVAGQYISDDVKKIVYADHPDYGDTTELYSGNLTGLNINDYIHIEIIGFTSDYYKDGKKFRVVDIIRNKQITEIVKGKEQTNTYNVIIIQGKHDELDEYKTKSIKWGIAKDDVTPQDIFRLSKGTSADRAIVAKYCIQDCNLVHHLMNKIDVITGYVEMSRICSVPISFLVFRGQGIKLTSYVAKKCREKNTLMPDLDKSYENDGYEGAIVLPPKCSMYMDNPVACVDYASLYPSSMISQNYSHDSKVWTKEYDLHGKLIKETGEKDASGNYIYDNYPGYEYIDIEFDTFKYIRKTPTSRAEKVKSGKMICRWAQLPENQKSIMPSILEELLKARSDTRKLIKTEKDPFMQNILDKRQLGYKVTANSLYGQCGAKTSTFYEKDVAASTTATGRMMITYAKRIIEEVYGDRIYDTVVHGPVKCNAEYVYGDTDSVFFTFNLENPETGEKIRGKPALEMTIEIAQDAAQLCSAYLKPPMELSYEKTLMPFVLLSKKRYVGMLYETDANKGKLKYMGLSLKRRDSCDYLKDTYGGILNILMKENNIQKAIEYLDQSLGNLINGTVPMDKLAITKALRSDYKNPNQIAHKVLADRIGKRDPGNKPKPGDRIKFLYVNSSTPKALLGERIETPEYITSQKLKIDYTYYITNQLMKPLQQLFGLAVEQIWEYQRKSNAIKTYKKDISNMEIEYGRDYELFMKKKEKYCSTKVKTLLFDKFLTKIANEKNKIQTITMFYR